MNLTVKVDAKYMRNTATTELQIHVLPALKDPCQLPIEVSQTLKLVILQIMSLAFSTSKGQLQNVEELASRLVPIFNTKTRLAATHKPASTTPDNTTFALPVEEGFLKTSLS